MIRPTTTNTRVIIIDIGIVSSPLLFTHSYSQYIHSYSQSLLVTMSTMGTKGYYRYVLSLRALPLKGTILLCNEYNTVSISSHR